MADYPEYTPEPDDPVGGTAGSGGTDTGTAVLTKTFTKFDAGSLVRFLVYASLVSVDDLRFDAYITIGQTIYQAAPVNFIFDNRPSAAAGPIVLIILATDLGAGQHTAVFSIRNNEPGGTLTARSGTMMEITELRQAAV